LPGCSGTGYGTTLRLVTTTKSGMSDIGLVVTTIRMSLSPSFMPELRWFESARA